MLIAYMTFGLFIGLFLFFFWSTDGGLNCIIKAMWMMWAIFSLILLVAAVFPELPGQMRWL